MKDNEEFTDFEYDDELRTFKFGDASTVEEWERMMDIMIANAKARKPGDYVWFMVGAGQRKEYLKIMRAYWRFKGVPPNIENIIKVVEEERA
jgi:hypothetical protein